MNKIKTAHWVLGAVLLLIIVFIILAFVMSRSEADDVTTSASIQNVAPTVDNVYINDDGSLAAGFVGGTVNVLSGGGTSDVYVTGIVSDPNGDEDIASVDVVFYRTNHASAENCVADNNDCYKDGSAGSCTLSTAYGDVTEASFSCTFSLQYFIDGTDEYSDSYSATDWTVYVKVTDDDAESDTDTSITKEMQTLLSVNIPASMDFGTMALGASTTNENNQEMSITQYGNESADLEVSGAVLDCSVGTGEIPVGNIEWSLTDVSMDSGTDLTGSAVDTDFAIGLRTDDVSPTIKKLFWNIAIPSSGIEGNCTGTTTITAKRAD